MLPRGDSHCRHADAILRFSMPYVLRRCHCRQRDAELSLRCHITPPCFADVTTPIRLPDIEVIFARHYHFRHCYLHAAVAAFFAFLSFDDYYFSRFLSRRFAFCRCHYFFLLMASSLFLESQMIFAAMPRVYAARSVRQRARVRVAAMFTREASLWLPLMPVYA